MEIKMVMKSPVAMLEPDTTVGHAETLLAHAGARALPVVDHGRLVGLVHRRDLLQARPSTVPTLARYEWAFASGEMRVKDVMRRQVVAVAPEADVHEVARIASSQNADAVPVVDGDEVVGVLSVRELLTVLVRELEVQRPPGLGCVLAAVGAGHGEQAALPAALGIARHHRARLILLHVLPPLRPRLVAEVARELLDRALAQRRAHTREWLASLVPDEPDVTVSVVEGDEAVQVVAAASRGAADLIVAEPALARAIANLAPCPVLAVPAMGDEYAGR
jgi:CBS domain-containing protein/nucleotide-binding universal stress UspA family protein